MFSFCNNEWILRIDADEEISPKLALEIKDKILKDKVSAYAMPRKNIIFGKWIKHALWYPDFQLRLVRKAHIKSLKNIKLHQALPIDGKIENLNSDLIHHNYESIDQYLDKLLRYTTIEASHRYQDKQEVDNKDLLTKPIEDFIKNFLVLKGYGDGMHGLALSLLQAFYEFLVLVKLWELSKFEPQIGLKIDEVEQVVKNKSYDWKWWKWETKIRKSDNPLLKTILKIRRKIMF